MNATATTRDWAGAYLTADEWNKLRPRIKTMGVRYNVSGMGEGVFFEAYVNDFEADAIEDALSSAL